MIRIVRYSAADPERANVPRIKIRPPVFKTPLDAWNHFIRHPDDFLPIDEDDENQDNLLQVYSDNDIFDQMDEIFNAPKDAEDTRHPDIMPKEGNDDRGSDDEGGATEGDVPTEA